MKKEEKRRIADNLAEDVVTQKLEGGLFLHNRTADLKNLYVEVTSHCNLDCRMCVRKTWPQAELGHMDPGLFKRLLGQLDSFPQISHLYLGGFGEPLFHPEIKALLKAARQKGLRLKLTTNGMLLDAELAKLAVELPIEEIIVSCDSLELSDFAHIRPGGDLDTVRSNLLALKRWKRTHRKTLPRLGLEFVLMRSNQDQLPLLPDFAREVQAGYVLVTNLLPYAKAMVGEVMYDPPRDPYPIRFWSNTEGDLVHMGTVKFPRMRWGAYRRCRFIENKAAVISWRGDVSPCYPLLHNYHCYVFGRRKNIKAYYPGNINTDSLLNIWRSPAFVKFRGRVNLFQFPSCVDCELSPHCEYPADNEDCWGGNPSCADCLWAQDIIRCP